MRNYLPVIAALILFALVIPQGQAAWVADGTGHWNDSTVQSGAAKVEMWNLTGDYTWTAPTGVTEVWYLVVAGGGSGGGGIGGGGGAGGLLNGTHTVVPGQTYNVTVGRGGLNITNMSGQNSSFANITPGDGFNSKGGGAGGNYSAAAGPGPSQGGGSAGGSGSLFIPGGLNVTGQGFNGSWGYGDTGSGGGGGSSAGQPLNATLGTGTNALLGKGIAINGTTIYYGDGGAGSGFTTAGTGAHGTSGAGSKGTDVAYKGTDGHGDGGGGGFGVAKGGSGGNGTVLLRYRIIDLPVADFTGTPVSGTAALLVVFTDHSTNESPITSWNWSFGDGDYSDSQNPQHVYATYGIYDVNLTITTAEDTVYRKKDDYITTSTEQGTKYYTPQSTRFTVNNYKGESISGAVVTLNVIETSLPDGVTYLTNSYGVTQSVAVQMLASNTTMTGHTGTDGSTVFNVHPCLKYWINVSASGAVVNESTYPIETDYTIWMPRASILNNYQEFNATLTFTEPNSSYFTLGAFYQDIVGNTSQALFYVNASNGTPVYQTSVAPGTANVTFNTTLLNVRGESYYWGLRCTRAAGSGGNVSIDQGVTAKGANGVLVDLRLPNNMYYPWIALFLIFLITSLSSKVNIRFMAILMPVMAAIFWWFGWLSGTYLSAVIPFCCILGVTYYMKGSLRENFGVGGPGSLLLNILVFMIILQSMIGFVNGLGIFHHTSIATPSNEYTNIGLTTVQTDCQNFGGINDPLQSSAALASIGYTSIKVAWNMFVSVFYIAGDLAEMFPYVPPAYFGVLQLGIWVLYIFFAVKFFGKSGQETDF